MKKGSKHKQYILMDTGKIHKWKRGYGSTPCGLGDWGSIPITKVFIDALPQLIRCKRCFRIKTPMKKRSLDYILGITKK